MQVRSQVAKSRSRDMIQSATKFHTIMACRWPVSSWVMRITSCLCNKAQRGTQFIKDGFAKPMPPLSKWSAMNKGYFLSSVFTEVSHALISQCVCCRKKGDVQLASETVMECPTCIGHSWVEVPGKQQWINRQIAALREPTLGSRAGHIGARLENAADPHFPPPHARLHPKPHGSTQLLQRPAPPVPASQGSTPNIAAEQ